MKTNKNIKEILSLLLLILIGVNGCSQDCDKLLSRKYLKSYWGSGLAVLSQPLHYEWDDWAVTAGVASMATLAFVYDEDINDFFSSTFGSETVSATRYSDFFGSEVGGLTIAAGMYIISAINKDCRVRGTSLAVLQALVFSEVAGAGIKFLSCRMRPTEGLGAGQWEGPFATFSSTSFVSGHAIRSFAVAATIAGMYADNPWVGVAAYSLAGLASFGRLVSGEHWSSDVIVGAAIGYFIGSGVVKFWRGNGSEKVSMMPYISEYGLGVALKF